MKLRVAVPAIVLMLASVVSTAHSDNFVYFSETPGTCTMEPGSYDDQTFSVFVLLDDPNVSAVSFWIKTNRFDASDVQSVTARPGAAIVAGNIFDGITVSIDGRSFVHEPVLDIVLSGHEPTGYVWTRDVVLTGGAGKGAPDVVTVAQGSDCFGTVAVWDVPRIVDVTIGSPDQFSFMAGLKDGSVPGNAEVRATDTEGWIDNSTPYGVEVACSWCLWSGTIVDVPVNIPNGVANNTLQEVTLEMWSYGQLVDTRTITLHAVSSVETEESTWGQIKGLYR